MATVGIDVGFLIEKIASVIENEASLIGGMSDELGEIKHELVSMRCFLEDSEKKRGLSEGERAWVAEVRDIANQVEDIIEEQMYHTSGLQHEEGKFLRHLYRTIYFPKNLLAKHRIATKLRKINKEIKSISERRQRYSVDCVKGRSSFDDHKWVQNRRESSIFLKDDELVGIEDDRQLLVGWLTDGERQRAVISVVGMGGSGKTTLVAKAYDNKTVKRHFDCYAWITVSQTYAIEDLFRSMIKQFCLTLKKLIPTELSTMNSMELREMLVNLLRPKRYVIVLDDVWSSTFWSELFVSFPDEGNRSRVMLTTRNENIASSSFGVKSYVHYIKPLGVTEAWDLFCMTTFSRNPNRRCPRELEELAHRLVTKCKGLPLAIVALGGCLVIQKIRITVEESL